MVGIIELFNRFVFGMSFKRSDKYLSLCNVGLTKYCRIYNTISIFRDDFKFFWITGHSQVPKNTYSVVEDFLFTPYGDNFITFIIYEHHKINATTITFTRFTFHEIGKWDSLLVLRLCRSLFRRQFHGFIASSITLPLSHNNCYYILEIRT